MNKREVERETQIRASDITYDRIPQGWTQGVFAGNGLLGVMAYGEEGSGAQLRFELGRGDVYDHREEDQPEEERQHEKGIVFRKCRLPIGFFDLCLEHLVQSAVTRMQIYDAVLSGEIRTESGEVAWRCFVPRDPHVILIELEERGEERVSLRFCPELSASPRKKHFPEIPYENNPMPYLTEREGTRLCVQPMLAGGSYVTAWKELSLCGRRILIASVGYCQEGNSSLREACGAIEAAEKEGIESLKARHASWWSAYYQKSGLVIPDKELERFYWVQLYKLASASCPDGPVIDTCGPWLKRDTGWPAIWWNLNVQLAYWICNTSNHLDMEESLIRSLDRNLGALSDNTPAQYRSDSLFLGNPTAPNLRCARFYNTVAHVATGEMECSMTVSCLPWVCHNYWLYYRYQMDDTLLRDRLFPLLKGTIQLYLHLVYLGEDGYYHLPETYSSEYGAAEDANQDLALLLWGCRTLLWICDRLHLDDEMIPRWKDVSERLTPFPVGETGLLVGKDAPFAFSHRHFSHLMAIFPLYLITIEDQNARELMEKSIRHWMSLDELLTGFSYTTAALLLECLGEGTRALDYIKLFLRQEYVHPNTMYTETGALQWPTLETPLEVGKCLHDMLLQSWGDKLRIFPAVPEEWKDAKFENFLAEGGFEVSAVRSGGETVFLRVKSLCGEPCMVLTDLDLEKAVHSPGKAVRREDGAYRLILAKGEEIVFEKAD